MHVKYQPSDPADGDPAEWDFNPRKLRASAAEVIEKRAGVPLQEFTGKVMKGDARCLRTLLWFLLWRDHPAIRFEEVDPVVADISVVPDRQERQSLREAAVGMRELTEEQRADFLQFLDDEDAKETAAAQASVSAATAADPEMSDPGKASQPAD